MRGKGAVLVGCALKVRFPSFLGFERNRGGTFKGHQRPRRERRVFIWIENRRGGIFSMWRRFDNNGWPCFHR